MSENENKTLFTSLDDNLNIQSFKVLYTWSSKDRQWEEKDKFWFASYFLFFVILVAIAVILGYYLLVLSIIAFAFLWFIQAIIPPQEVEHKITTI
ncbi:MAG: hypothetical protein NZZ41_05285, partial [Candidatus Dojkabacteria bacterium]|nr:hypothetical protein [Candidatus Dojkabacteria bacterium]